MARASKEPVALGDLIRKGLKNADAVAQHFQPTDYISTGLPNVDDALGRPGVACGRLTVIRGEPSTSKSSLVYRLIQETLRRDGVAILMETEEGVEIERLRSLGVDVDSPNFVILQPIDKEETFNEIGEVIDTIRATNPDILTLIVWDSVAATATSDELVGSIADSAPGKHSRVVSKGLRRYTGKIARHRIALVFVNQLREKIGGQAWTDNKTMMADRPLRFHASAVIDVTRTNNLNRSGTPVGIDIKLHVSKNKLASPYRTVPLSFYFATGFDVGESWLDLAQRVGTVKKQGGWYTFPDGEKRQRRVAAAALLESTDLQTLVLTAADRARAALATPVAEEEEDDE